MSELDRQDTTTTGRQQKKTRTFACLGPPPGREDALPHCSSLLQLLGHLSAKAAVDSMEVNYSGSLTGCVLVQFYL